MRISIDRSLCSGHGRCYTVAPEVFGYDDQGFSKPKFDTVPPELVEAAGRGAEACPEVAITLEGDQP
jgi:ferredoxin